MGLDVFIVKRKSTQLGYFRKVNFLMSFFNKYGYDDKNCIAISMEMAKELAHRCKEVLEDHSKAEKLLPTKSGFFFGSTEYDEYYYDDVKEVLEFVEDTLIPELDQLDEDETIIFDSWW